jgi:hypothetical protein
MTSSSTEPPDAHVPGSAETGESDNWLFHFPSDLCTRLSNFWVRNNIFFNFTFLNIIYRTRDISSSFIMMSSADYGSVAHVASDPVIFPFVFNGFVDGC